MVASTLPLPAGADPTPQALQWGEAWLYLHNDDELTPAPNSGEPAPSQGATRTWQMPEGLAKNLCIEATDPATTASGFTLFLNISGFSFSSDWSITVRLLDEETVLAEETVDVDQNDPFAKSEWLLAYTSSRTTCTVLSGHRLAVEYEATITVFIPRIVGAHLVIWAQDALAPTIATENPDGPTDIFYPYDIDGSRSVIINGTLNNAFPASLVTAVRIGIDGPGGGSVLDTTATVQDDNFTYTWTYARGATGGAYNVLIEVEDRQGNIYEATATFLMAPYGLRITVPGQVDQTVTGYTIPGESAFYDLTVTNVGSSPTVVQMVTENPPVSGWSASFSSDSFGLSPGNSNVTVFRSTPGASILPGNSAQATVVAQAQDDPAAIKARASLLTTTIVQREAALSIEPPSTDATIRLGGSVEYDFSLTNNGGLITDVELGATASPAGWTRRLSGDSVVVDGGGWKLIGLPSGVTRTITLNVTAPIDTTSTDEFECTVTARAVGNSSAVATFVARTQLLLGIELSQASPTGVPAVAPGGRVEFQVDVINTDPLNPHTISQAGTTTFPSDTNPDAVFGSGAPVVEVFAPADGSCCDPHQSATISVIVQMPARALPGRYVFELATVVDSNSARVAVLNLSVDVDRQVQFSVSVDDSVGPLTVGNDPARFEATVSNDGNTPVLVNLLSTVGDTRPGEDWDVTFYDQNGSEISRVTVGPYQEVIVTVEVVAPGDAFHGDVRPIKLSAEQVGGDARAELAGAIDATVELDPTDRFIRLLSAQYIVLFVLGFVFWGFVTASWGRAVWRRSRGGGGAEGATASEKSLQTPREVK
jgi:hypothetical protein